MKQRWYQISLSAATIIMLLSGILVGTIVSSVKEEAEAKTRYDQRLQAAKLREEQLRFEEWERWMEL